jgi:hypothetical protein
MKIAVCLLGHYRSFDRVSACWGRLKAKYDIDFYISTWDCVNSNTQSWHKTDGNPTESLTQTHINILKSFDPEVTIMSQSWVTEERADIYLDMPIKCFEYRFQMYHNLVNRIHSSKKTYDLIVFSRLDVAIGNIVFSPVAEGTIHIGYRSDERYSYSTAASDILFAIHPDDLSFMISPHLSIRKAREMGLYKKPEDYANDYYNSLWVAVIPTWKYDIDFTIVR